MVLVYRNARFRIASRVAYHGKHLYFSHKQNHSGFIFLFSLIGVHPRNYSTQQTMRAALGSRRIVLYHARNTCRSPVRLTRHWTSSRPRRCLSTDQTLKGDTGKEELRELALQSFVCYSFYAYFCALLQVSYTVVLSEAGYRNYALCG